MTEEKKVKKEGKKRKPNRYYDKYTQEFVLDYCDKNNEQDWLEEQISAMDKNKKGAEHPRSFSTIQKNFVKKFFPEDVPESAKKGSTFRDKAKALIEKKKKK